MTYAIKENQPRIKDLIVDRLAHVLYLAEMLHEGIGYFPYDIHTSKIEIKRLRSIFGALLAILSYEKNGDSV